MARQAQSFRNVGAPPTEATIKPIYGNIGSFRNESRIFLTTLSATDADTAELVIRPPAGVTWRTLYLSVTWIAVSGGSAHATAIQSVDTDGTNRDIVYQTGSTTRGVGAVLAGTSPILLTNKRYIRLASFAAGVGSHTSSAIAVIEVVN